MVRQSGGMSLIRCVRAVSLHICQVLHDAAGDAASADACSRNALLAGLLDAPTSTGPSGTTVTAKKPTWEMGAKFSLRKKPAATTATNTTTTAWKLVGSDACHRT